MFFTNFFLTYLNFNNMKRFLALLLVGVFSLSYVPKADGQDAGNWKQILDVITVVVDEVSDGCDNLREEGRLQKRCKNQACDFVACISFRKSCEGLPDDCKK
jgi:hypothetical protein